MAFSTKFTYRQALIAWTLCCVLAGGVFLVYALTSLVAGHGQYVMPLDDVYIHFQYAKQMALGQPYVYNTGQPPTSGATSFLYPFVLAFGYLIGFQGLNLGLWAMLIGMFALVGSAWLIVLLARALNAPYWLTLVGASLFTLSGAISWHFMSGMETGLVILFLLLTLYQFVCGDARGVGIAGSLLSLIRPEGGLLAVLAVVLMFFVAKKDHRWLVLPLLALGVQPVVNLMMTGSMVATGNQAKSLLGMTPFYWDEVIRRILDNFLRMWIEFTTGISPREGWYLPLGVSLLALVGWLGLMWQRETRVIGLLIIGWLLAGTAAVSTLDTAFWHFKRYQMPLLSLLFPLALWGISWLANRQLSKAQNFTYSAALRLISLLLVAMALWTGANFLRHCALNVSYVYAQPLQMAYWLDANTPPDATVAVHDVGMMRYMGNRTTIDMVGLTTPSAADAWRNGPGTVAEFLIEQRPDYIAAYISARGLSYLAETGIYNYGNALAEFPVTVDVSSNVALAAETPEVTQGIYQPDWTSLMLTPDVLQPTVLNYLNLEPSDYQLVDSINVANLASEQSHQYHWQNGERRSGFASEVRDMSYVDCIAEPCRVMDGGRLINGAESFTISTPRDGVAILITRLHPQFRGTLDIYVNGNLHQTRIIPQIAGQWLEVATIIYGTITDQTAIRIVPHVRDGYYMPYRHWIYQDRPRGGGQIGPIFPVQFYQDDLAVNLCCAGTLAYSETTRQLDIDLSWLSTAGQWTVDYRLFAHVYADIDASPVAQADTYPGHGTMPPGNWLGSFDDRISIDMSNVPAGMYQVAIGFYNPVTFARLSISPLTENMREDLGVQFIGDGTDGRLFIGTIEIPEN